MKVRGKVVAAAFGLAVMVWVNWKPAESGRKSERATRAQIPLSFEVNRGQAAAGAKYVARGGGYSLVLTDRGEPVLTLAERHAGQRSQASMQGGRGIESEETAERTPLRLEFAGSNAAPEGEGEQPLPGRSNYLIGNDPSRWLVDVPHFARVRYREVYPGVDVVYYAKDQRLEYDFIVSPGTDPDAIRMMVHDAEGIQEDGSGNLALKTSAGDVRLHKPVAYQGGADGEREVACDYVVDGGEIRFALGEYDRSQTLRIDPVLAYSIPLGALVRAIAVDASGNSYVAGRLSASFTTTPSAFQPVPASQTDAVIAKMDPTGSTLLFATYLGGSAYDSADSIALDASGNVIVAGTTYSPNLPVRGAFQSTLLGTNDAFVSKLSADGTQLLYSTYLGGSGTESALGVAVDPSGRMTVAGLTSSANFPTNAGSVQPAYGGGDADAFVAKLDPSQPGVASLLYSTYLGGRNRDAAGAIAVDAVGNAYVTGLTLSPNFPTASALQASCASCPAGPDTPQVIPAAAADAFVAKLNPAGSVLVYSTFLGGNRGEAGNAIVVDSAGDAYVAGQTFSWSGFPTTVGAFQTQGDGDDGFVSKLNPSGSGLLYSTLIGGAGDDLFTGMALDSSGGVYLAGASNAWDFPTVNPLQGPGKGVCDYVLFPDGCSDAVVLRLNESGSALTFSTYVGEEDVNESGTGVAADANGNIYMAGATRLANFTDLLSLLRLGLPGSGNNIPSLGFVAKISPVSGTEPTSTQLTSSQNPSGEHQTVTFTATVTPTGASGRVIFRDGDTPLGSPTLDAHGMITFGSSSLSAGNHLITTEYLGDSRFAGSRSAVVTQVVNGISISASQTSATTARGGTATFPLMVGQAGALTAAIAFSCSGLPAGWSCGFSPATVPAGSAPTQVMLTVQAGSAAGGTLPDAPTGGPMGPASIWFGALVLLMVGIWLEARGRRTAYLRPAVALGVAALFLVAAGCGSSSQPPQEQTQQPQSSTVTFMVSATSSGATSSVPLTITVR